jgi:arginase
MTDSSHLRLVWPQWQGAGASSVTELAAEFPLGTAHRGYAIGSRVLEAVLPPHDGPTEHVPVEMSDRGRATEDGVESKQIVLEQLEAALTLIGRHDPERISTLGGECSVSVAPFSALAARYGDDLAIVWIDAHPDVDTGETSYDGYHAMALALLTGHGDPELLAKLPGTVDTSRVLLWRPGASAAWDRTNCARVRRRCSTGCAQRDAAPSPCTWTWT